MPRKFCVGGNWKMNGDKKSIKEICSFLNAGPLDSNVEVMFKLILFKYLRLQTVLFL